MKHTCGIDGDAGAVTPLDGRCAACERPAEQRVDDATRATEAHWRPIVANLNAENAQLRSTENMYRTLVAILKDENVALEKECKRLRGFAGKDLI
jgi:hypothetical protein